jgi:hypothetical protein
VHHDLILRFSTEFRVTSGTAEIYLRAGGWIYSLAAADYLADRDWFDTNDTYIERAVC